MPSLYIFEAHPDQESIKRNKQLFDMLEKKTSFNPNDPTHCDLINNCSDDLKHKLNSLKSLDQRIIAGFVLSTAVVGLSFILPIMAIAVVGFMFSVYCLCERMRVSPEYRRSQMALVGCMEWTLGNLPTDNDKANNVINCPAVATMFETLAPLMSKQQLIDAIDDSQEMAFVSKADELNSNSREQFLGHPLSKEDRAVGYGIYGFGKGKPKDVIDGLLNLARQGWNAAKQAVKGNREAQPEAASVRP